MRFGNTVKRGVSWRWPQLACTMLASTPIVLALSRSDMRRPLSGQITPSASVFETEDHVIFGQHISVQSDSNKWNVDTIGATWHVWHYTTILDSIDLPLWPASMLEARVVLTSEMCRDSILLPPAPFMPPRGLEYCGVHVAATANPDASGDLALARSHMRSWMADLMGWSSSNPHSPNLLVADQDPRTEAESNNEPPEGPSSFIDLGNSSIYYFHSFNAQNLDVNRPGSRLDLARFALEPQHPLHALIDPH
ncbi:hypothetical protein FBU31_004517, partial [Coemansia sp. 'formosensis']